LGRGFQGHQRRGGAGLGRRRPGRGAGGRPWRPRSNTGVVPGFQGSFKHVSNTFQASSLSLPLCSRAGHPRLAGTLALPSFVLPRCPRAGHRCGPASERRGVPTCPGLRYRLGKRWQGYRDLTSFKPATCTGAVAGWLGLGLPVLM
jgi:hypothetical protein